VTDALDGSEPGVLQDVVDIDPRGDNRVEPKLDQSAESSSIARKRFGEDASRVVFQSFAKRISLAHGWNHKLNRKSTEKSLFGVDQAAKRRYDANGNTWPDDPPNYLRISDGRQGVENRPVVPERGTDSARPFLQVQRKILTDFSTAQ
jgi:hypothetical protein